MFTNSSIKGTIIYFIVLNHSQGHKNEPMTFWMILLQGVGTNVFKNIYILEPGMLLNNIYS